MQVLEQVKAVRDDPEGRYQLRVAFYRRYGAGHFETAGYGESELAFLRWEIDRGVLNPVNRARSPGSQWWRQVNEDFLNDAELAAEIQEGRSGRNGNSVPVKLWLSYLRRPSRQTWYRAHNASIVAGYLRHAGVARSESDAEQKFMNIVLYRVLYAQMMVEGQAPGIRFWLARKIFGRDRLMRRLERIVADPRGLSVDVLVHLHDFYPRHYPLGDGDIEPILRQCHCPEQYAQILMDKVLISPHLTRLYALGASWLQTPALRRLVRNGTPIYPHHE